MKRLDWNLLDADARAQALRRPTQATAADTRAAVARIIAEARSGGDAGLLALTRRYDRCQLGALAVDAAEFSRDVGAVHLHLRADSLMEPRPVLFVWTHAGEREEVRGVLAPTTTLTLAASHPIAAAASAPTVDAAGGAVRGEPWQVEVYSADAAGQAGELLFRREFLVL